MREMLTHRGHKVVAVIAGTNGKRPLPDYVQNAFGGAKQLNHVQPRFPVQGGTGHFRRRGSVVEAFGRLPEFRQSLRLLDETIARTKPDLIINFLEAATGVGKFLRRIKIPVLVLGHQFMLGHPAFVRSSHARTQQMGFRPTSSTSSACVRRNSRFHFIRPKMCRVKTCSSARRFYA